MVPPIKSSIIISSIFIFLFVGNHTITFAQPIFKYKDYIKKPEDTRIIERKVWRYNLQKDRYKVSLPRKNDTLYKFDTIRSVDNSILKINSEIVQITCYNSTSSGYTFPDTTLYSKELFNEKGLCIFMEGYFSGIDSPNYLYKHYKYDNKNREIVSTNSYQSITSPSVHKKDFNDRNLTVYDNAVYGGGYLINKYDKTGKLFQMEHYDTSDCIEGKTVYTYSKDGQFIKEMYIGTEADGGFRLYKFNKSGNILESIIFECDSVFSQGHYFDYDRKGNLLEDTWVTYLGDPPRESIKNHYNSKGKLLNSKVKYENNEYYIYKKCFYRKDGLLDYELYLDDKGNATTKYQYQYKLR